MKRYILLLHFLMLITVSVFSLYIVDDIIKFIGGEVPLDFTHVKHSGYDYHVKTIEDAYDHQKSLFFWLNDEGAIATVAYKINCKSSYYIDAREVSHYESQLDYEGINFSYWSTPTGIYQQYLYDNFIVSYETNVDIISKRVKTITWNVQILTQEERLRIDNILKERS